MNNDLISREALKKAVEDLVAGGSEGLKDYYENGSKSDENAWIGGIYDAWELIDNEPTVLTVPDNPTNGDIIMALFPNRAEFNGGEGSFFLKDWWNAPYNKEADNDI